MIGDAIILVTQESVAPTEHLILDVRIPKVPISVLIQVDNL